MITHLILICNGVRHNGQITIAPDSIPNVNTQMSSAWGKIILLCSEQCEQIINTKYTNLPSEKMLGLSDWEFIIASFQPEDFTDRTL